MPLGDFENLFPVKKVLQTNTKVYASVYPHRNTSIFKQRSIDRIDFSDDLSRTMGHVMSLSYSHYMGQQSANFELQIKVPRNSQIDVERGDITDYDWIDIEVFRNGVLFPLLRGVIDTVSQDDRSSGGATVRTISLQGRSHGALFESIIAWNNAYVQTLQEIVGGIFKTRMSNKIGGSPSETFKILFDATFNSAVNPATASQWILPESLQSTLKATTFGQACTLVADIPSPTRGKYYNTVALWTNPGDTLHGAFTEWCNPTFNEIFYDLAPYPDVGNRRYEMQATIRERPFINTIEKTNSPFFKLKKWTVPQWVIGSRALSRSGQERFSVIQLNAQYQYGNTAFDQHALAPVLMNLSDSERYGIRPMECSTKYYDDSPGKWLETRSEWMRLLCDWYAANPYFLNGTVSGIKPMLPEIRIGQRLAISDPSEKKEHETTFYIEGVTHNYAYARSGADGTKCDTQLRLTRGIKGTSQQQVAFIQEASNRFKETTIEE